MPYAAFIAGIAMCLSQSSASAQVPRALPEGTLPHDVRLQPPKDLDGYFPFHPAKSPEEWAKRAERVRRQMLVALNLWPMPEKTPLHAVIHGKIDRGDYTVEKVYFESYPGFYVTGSLYRPKDKGGKLPGVLSPHGHWENGRFYDQGTENVRREIVQGAERFEEGGRSPLQSRCVQLARMGSVVFHYDMVGYADSVQISETLAHRFAKQRPEMNTTEDWGLFSPQAEAHLQSVMGLQTWDSIRALDFLLSLPDVDSQRIAVTGASGGGTQTFVLCGLDPRPTVAFPAVMVSTAMQGGCTCENASLLRIDTGNVEFAALFAPKPLGMTAADDWTKEMPSKGFPELKQHFAMMGAPDHVMLKPLLHFGHNYNYVSRAAMYGWLNQHLGLGFKDPVVEEDYRRLSRSELSVWDENHPKPEGGPEFERKLLRYLTAESERQLQPARASLERYREVVGGAVDILIGRNLREVGDIELQDSKAADRNTYLEMAGLLRNQTHGEELPILMLRPKQPQNRTVIWVDVAGKAGLFEGGQLVGEVQRLLAAGTAVIGVDLLFQGEFLGDGKAVTQNRRVKNPREFGGFTYGYNDALFAQRVHDLLTVIKYAQRLVPQPASLSLVGCGGAGPWVAAALAQGREAVTYAVLDTGGFRFGKLLDLWDASFLPGGAKYGDLPGMLALAAPTKLWLAGEGEQAPEVVQAIYAAAQAGENLTTYKGDPSTARAAGVQWLLDHLRN
jgi:dienelactone hydrolase